MSGEQRPHLYLVQGVAPAIDCVGCKASIPDEDKTTIVVVSQFRGITTTSHPVDLCLACTEYYADALNLETTS